MKLQHLDLDGYLGLVKFGEGQPPRFRKDWRHLSKPLWPSAPTDSNRGRGLVIQASRNEFYLVGANYRLFLRPKVSPDKMRASSLVSDHILNLLTPYISVDEGHFGQNGEFVVDRRRNGDEVSSGTWVEPDVGVVRVIMCG